MSTATWIIIAVIGFIISGIYFIYKSAQKFNLSKEQLAKINQRNKELEQEEKEND